MKKCSSQPLGAWLTQVCKMMPGVKQALVIYKPEDSSECSLQWPLEAKTAANLVSTAELAFSQMQTVSTLGSQSDTRDMASDIIIAYPFGHMSNTQVVIAVNVKIKPSQQAVVMQILKWGEEWFHLLGSQQQDNVEPVPAPDRKSLFNSINKPWWLLAFFMLLLIMGAMPASYKVSAPAYLEGRIQLSIVAPFDGYIAQAHQRAGELVKQGDTIAELDSRELILEQKRFEAELNEYSREYRQALVTREQMQAQIYKSKMQQAEAQINLLGEKLQRTRLVSPLDGIIIEGDLSQSLGSPVVNGDILFKVAPLDDYRVVILVSEKQIVDVSQGLTGHLTLKSLPMQPIEFVVDKVSPVFEDGGDGIAYRVEAVFHDDVEKLRPGMQGTAKITIGQRSFLWIYFHDLYDAFRLLLWSWLP